MMGHISFDTIALMSAATFEVASNACALPPLTSISNDWMRNNLPRGASTWVNASLYRGLWTWRSSGSRMLAFRYILHDYFAYFQIEL
jgi:hypothetical protein